MALKSFKVGTVQKKKSGDGVTVALGQPNAKDAKWVTNVEIRVTDGTGKVLAHQKNGFLVVKDPRKRTNKDGTPLSEEQAAKIPDYIKNELFVMVDEA